MSPSSSHPWPDRRSDQSDIKSVPPITNGNAKSHSVGPDQMDLHGYLPPERVHYGSEEGVDFTNIYFANIVFHVIQAFNLIANASGVLEAAGRRVHWVDSWYYHTHKGGIHCGTNALRRWAYL